MALLQHNAEDLAPRNVMARTNDTACNSVYVGPLEVDVSWEPPRIVANPIKGYNIHVVTVNGNDSLIHVDANVNKHVVYSMECWNAYILRVEALFESGASALSASVLYATGNRTHKYFPQDLHATENRTRCDAGGDYASVVLQWKPAQLGNFSVTAYNVVVFDVNDTSKPFRVPADTTIFTYDNVGCNGTTVFGVSTVLFLSSEAFHGVGGGEFVYPAAYVAASTEMKAELHNVDGAVPSAASSLSTSAILCIILIPLAVILLTILLFLGYKKYKQNDGRGLLRNDDSP
ncbi:uncharacterized protein [Dermacentor andersoni]|uniref:uncharacterized protein n=1 Tax=Dermacentor andersoni TaxID=34620 RepID=UPI002416F199|nr:uncharacterized protein LOC126546057 [Dermacentor andersoni]XP_054933676.1 uncharacterized protein LOC126546057 [Dermacentor andersoni]